MTGGRGVVWLAAAANVLVLADATIVLVARLCVGQWDGFHLLVDDPFAHTPFHLKTIVGLASRVLARVSERHEALHPVQGGDIQQLFFERLWEHAHGLGIGIEMAKYVVHGVDRGKIDRVFYWLSFRSLGCLTAIALFPLPEVRVVSVSIWIGAVGLARVLLRRAYK